MTLTGINYAVFVACDDVTTEDELIRSLAGAYPADALRSAVDRMVIARIVYRSRSRQLVNLPLLRECPPVNMPEIASSATGGLENPSELKIGELV